jgi:hypothetical protein
VFNVYCGMRAACSVASALIHSDVLVSNTCKYTTVTHAVLTLCATTLRYTATALLLPLQDTSGSFEALKAEVSSLRAQLAAAAVASGVSPATSALTCSGGTVSAEYLAAHAAAAAAAEADPALALGVLIEALRRGAAAEAARDAANRRAASLAALAEKAEK